MSKPSRVPAVLAYLPCHRLVVRAYFQRRNRLAVYHLRQSIALCLFLIAVLVIWAVVAWITGLGSVPVVIGSIALFAIVIAAYVLRHCGVDTGHDQCPAVTGRLPYRRHGGSVAASAAHREHGKRP